MRASGTREAVFYLTLATRMHLLQKIELIEHAEVTLRVPN